MRILFMGTPDIAARCLSAILDAGHDVCAVYTREDKPVGRRRVMTAPPVKNLALERGLPVVQPKTLRTPQAAQAIQALAPDMIVVVAYGRILPPAILDIPPLGCVNLHVSLLPAYRGAAPIQWAVANGETQTGVTVMYMDQGVDTGDIIAVEPFPIEENDTSEDVFEKAGAIGAPLLVKTIGEIAAGTARPTPQNHALATAAPPLTKEMGRFTFDMEARRIHALARGLYPWPCASFSTGGKTVKVLSTRRSPLTGPAGQVLSLKPLTVACGSEALVLLQVQSEGSRPMEGTAWAAGLRLKVGDSLTVGNG